MKVLVAGGGTGGHLFPGVAIAEDVSARGGQVLFVGTERGIESRVVPAAGYPLEFLRVTGLKRMSVGKTLLGLARVPGALLASRKILRRFRPDVVVGVGGYASGPMVLVAALSGYPTAILEQNSVPGFTNRMLARSVRAIFLGFEDATARFPARKCVVTGNPVRRAFRDAALRAATTSPVIPAAPGGAGASSTPRPFGELRVLIVGGSQGARAVNDLVVSALTILSGHGRAPRVFHQTGPADLDNVVARYGAAGLGDRVAVRAFIDDMVGAYTDADLVIARAGALTLAELAMIGRAAILIPLPTAADDHQSRNAAAFARAGAALVFDQRTGDPTALAGLIGELLDDPARRALMSTTMRTLARPSAGADIVDRLQALADA